ncbi:MAG: PQQ-dependent sugar dehydrogenase [Pseudomonadota bacterium]
MPLRRPLAALSLAAALAAAPALAQTFDTSAGPVRVDRMVDGVTEPWGFAFLPDGGVLITEKAGDLRLWRDGALSGPISGVPEVTDSGQGGLLDVALARDFAETREVYLSYSRPDGFRSSQTAVARARLSDDGSALENVEDIFRQIPSQASGRHFGSRIVVAEDGSLFVTIGDRGERQKAQDLAAHQGSLLRIMRDGSPHPENPFIGNGRGWLPEIYSYGHRNQQGATLAPDGTLWTVEHGAAGGDEINRPEVGVNYGWPTISYGTHYSGAKIGVGREAEGMAQPRHYWDPSIAPSGLAWYDGEMFPEWRGDLLVGALKYRLISRLDVEGGEIVGEERLFADEFGRVRDVRQAPDGSIWFATDQRDGGLYRISRAN